MATAELKLEIGVVDKASASIGKLSTSILGLGKTALGIGGTITKAIGGIALGGAVAGIGALSAAIVGGIGDAREAAKVFAQTEAVLKSTGGASGKTAEQISDLAASLSAASGASLFGDDLIQQSSNLLLTFTNLKGPIVDAATAISVDMAQALGGAPADAAVQLGKALNDPIAGISALSRVGVTFSEDQKKVIAGMVETGNVAGAQQVILAELNKEFGGSAAAAAAADGGFAQFQDRLGEMAETVGAMVLPALNNLLGWFNSPDVMGAIEGFVTNLTTGLITVGETVGAAVTTITGIVGHVQAAFADGGITAAIDTLLFDIGKVIPAVEPVTSWLRDIMPQAVSVLTTAFNLARDGITTFITAYNGEWANSEKVLLIHQAFGLLGETIGIVRDSVLTFIAAYNGDWQNSDDILLIHQAFGVLGQVISETVVPALQSMVGWFQQNTELVTQIGIAVGVAVAVFQTLSTVVAVVGTVTAAIGGMGTAITAAGGIVTTIIAVLGGPLTIALAAVALAAGAFALAWETNFGGIREKTAAVVDWWTATAWPALVAGFNTVVEHVGLLKAAWDRDFESVRGFIQTMQEKWDTAVAAIGIAIDLVKTYVSDMKTEIGNRIDEAVAFFTELPGRVTDAVSGLAGDLLQMGKDAIQGFIDGLKSINVGSILGGILQAGIAAAKAAIQSHSPSRLTQKELGEPIMDGVIKGVDGRKAPYAQALKLAVLDPVIALAKGLKVPVDEATAHLDKLIGTVEKGAKVAYDEATARYGKMVGAYAEETKKLKVTADEATAHFDKIVGAVEKGAKIPYDEAIAQYNNMIEGYEEGSKRLKVPVDEATAHLDKLVGAADSAGKGLKVSTEEATAHLDKLVGAADGAAKGLKVPADEATAHLRKILNSVQDTSTDLKLTAPTMMTPLVSAVTDATMPLAQGGDQLTGEFQRVVDEWNRLVDSIKVPEFKLNYGRGPNYTSGGEGGGNTGGGGDGGNGLSLPGGTNAMLAVATNAASSLGDILSDAAIKIPTDIYTKHIKDATDAAQKAYDKAKTAASDAQTKVDDLIAKQKAIRDRGKSDPNFGKLSDYDTQIAAAEAAMRKAQEAADEAHKAIGTVGEKFADEAAAIANKARDNLFSIGSAFGSIGTALANYGIKPINAELAAAEKAIADFNAANPGVDYRDTAEGTRLEERRLKALGEQTALQKEMLRIQQAQEKLGFLQQQTKLLDLIQQYGLDPSTILGNTKLGLGANVTSLSEALARAMEAIVAQLDKRISQPVTNPGAILNSYAAMPNMLTMPRVSDGTYTPMTTNRAPQTIDNRVIFEKGALVVNAAPGQDARQLARDLMPEIHRMMREQRNR